MAEHNEPLVRLARYVDQIEAQDVVNLLRSHQIDATATGGFTSEFQIGIRGSVDVYVNRRDVAEAAEILREIEHDANILLEADRPENSGDEAFGASAAVGSNRHWGLLLVALGGILLSVLTYATGARSLEPLFFSFWTGSSLAWLMLWTARRVKS